MKPLRILALLFALGLPWNPAYALVFTEFGALSLSNPRLDSRVDPSENISPSLSLGGGFSLGFRFLENTDVETGVAYIGESFSVTQATESRAVYKMWSAQIPLILRYWFTPKLSAGGGIYFSHTMGRVSIHQNGEVAYVNSADLGWAQNDAGLTASFRYRSPLTDLISFVLDGRILFGIQDRNTSLSDSTLQTRTLQFWTGIAFIL